MFSDRCTSPLSLLLVELVVFVVAHFRRRRHVVQLTDEIVYARRRRRSDVALSLRRLVLVDDEEGMMRAVCRSFHHADQVRTGNRCFVHFHFDVKTNTLFAVYDVFPDDFANIQRQMLLTAAIGYVKRSFCNLRSVHVGNNSEVLGPVILGVDVTSIQKF